MREKKERGKEVTGREGEVMVRGQNEREKSGRKKKINVENK